MSWGGATRDNNTEMAGQEGKRRRRKKYYGLAVLFTGTGKCFLDWIYILVKAGEAPQRWETRSQGASPGKLFDQIC